MVGGNLGWPEFRCGRIAQIKLTELEIINTVGVKIRKYDFCGRIAQIKLRELEAIISCSRILDSSGKGVVVLHRSKTEPDYECVLSNGVKGNIKEMSFAILGRNARIKLCELDITNTTTP